MPPSEKEVEQAKQWKNESKRLKKEAEELWGAVQTNSDIEAIQKKVERLKTVEVEMKQKADAFITLLNANPELASMFDKPNREAIKRTVSKERRRSMFSSCRFAEIDDEEELNSRASMSSVDRKSRVVMIPTDSELFGEVECIIIEPAIKMISPEHFVTTGVVVCMQGLLPPSKDTIKEWAVTNDIAGWTQMGASVVIPNVQANSALDRHDVADIVNGICDHVCFDRVLLVGKDLVAGRLLELACEPKFDRSIAGVMLLGPTTPPRLVTTLPCPLFLLWAQDDEVCPFMDHVEWVEMVKDGKVSIITNRWCETGGHDFSHVATQEGVGDMIKNFFISAVLASDLLESDSAHSDTQKVRSRLEQLTMQLPASVRDNVNAEPDASTTSLTRKQRMSITVGQWIAGGMRDGTAQLASE